MRFGDSDVLELRSEAYVAGLGGEKAVLKVKVAGRREFAGYWEYLLDNAIFTVPAYPLWGGSALVGQDGTLLGIGSLLVQEALGPGAPAFPGNMYVPINRLKPIFSELVTKGQLSTPPRPWLGLPTVEHMGQLVGGGISDGGPADRADRDSGRRPASDPPGATTPGRGVRRGLGSGSVAGCRGATAPECPARPTTRGPFPG
jgi:S1-C subfamily serine protease